MPITSYDGLAGWDNDDHHAALAAFRLSAPLIAEGGLNFAKPPTYAGIKEDWLIAIEGAMGSAASDNPRSYFEKHFIPCLIADKQRPEGMFTGYFEPVVRGSRSKSAAFPVPVYQKPPDLVAFDAGEQQSTALAYGKRTARGPAAYDSRHAIETGALANQGLEICWLDSWIDAFFMHIQGSGRVLLDDGTTLRLGYAAKSGQPYVAIGAVLLERGALSRQALSMQSIATWMRANPSEARELMWKNPSYIFFRELPSAPENLGAFGAGKVNLVPQRSLAIDASHYLYGTPLWLETTTPPESPQGQQPFNHLMLAHDTGSAIRGLQRGDVYWGWGDEAAVIAGHMKSPGHITTLLPPAVVQRLGL